MFIVDIPGIEVNMGMKQGGTHHFLEGGAININSDIQGIDDMQYKNIHYAFLISL